MKIEPVGEIDQRFGGEAFSLVEAPYKGGYVSLRLGSNGNRIDWFAGTVQGLVPVGDNPIAGTVDDWVAVFREITGAFTGDAKVDVNRMAVGLVLLEPVPTKEAGYQRLNEHLDPHVKLDPRSSEFRYQVNRPRPSAVLEGNVNRVSEWSVARLQATKSGMDFKPGDFSYMVRLALDINTPPDAPEAIPHDRQGEVIEELLELGLEIAREGDIA
jgi:hypothetical protein